MANRRVCLLILLLINLRNNSVLANNGPENVAFNVSVTGFGFHRNLQITANLPPSWNGCELLLLLNIPAGAYINPYELEADGEAPFHFENLPVDIEQTAEDSTPNSLKLLTKLDCHEVCQYLVTLPTHLRYHSPRTSDSVYVRVPFSPGTITKSCPGSKEPTKYTITFGKATTTMAGTLILLYRIMKPMSPS